MAPGHHTRNTCQTFRIKTPEQVQIEIKTKITIIYNNYWETIRSFKKIGDKSLYHKLSAVHTSEHYKLVRMFEFAENSCLDCCEKKLVALPLSKKIIGNYHTYKKDRRYIYYKRLAIQTNDHIICKNYKLVRRFEFAQEQLPRLL